MCMQGIIINNCIYMHTQHIPVPLSWVELPVSISFELLQFEAAAFSPAVMSIIIMKSGRF